MDNVALLGAGRMGRIHARNAANHPGLRLRYVVDAAQAAAADLAGEYGAAVADVDAVLGDPAVAGVIIASSTDTHLDYCLRAIAAGKAVFCEKPIDFDLANARSAKGALGGADTRLLLGFNRRFDAQFQALKAKLESGAVGALETLHIISHDPAPPPAGFVGTSGGLFKDMTIHDFDMARWLMAEEPVEVFASASCLIDPSIGEAGDVDTAKTLLRTGSGRICLISNNRRSGYGYDQRVEAFGAKGLARLDNRTQSTVSVWGESGAAADKFHNFFLDRYAEAFRREMAHFAQLIRGEVRASVGYADAVAALALAEAAGESSRTGRMVRL